MDTIWAPGRLRRMSLDEAPAEEEPEPIRVRGFIPMTSV
jgi:hypothetical protein